METCHVVSVSSLPKPSLTLISTSVLLSLGAHERVANCQLPTTFCFLQHNLCHSADGQAGSIGPENRDRNLKDIFETAVSAKKFLTMWWLRTTWE